MAKHRLRHVFFQGVHVLWTPPDAVPIGASCVHAVIPNDGKTCDSSRKEWGIEDSANLCSLYPLVLILYHVSFRFLLDCRESTTLPHYRSMMLCSAI